MSVSHQGQDQRAVMGLPMSYSTSNGQASGATRKRRVGSLMGTWEFFILVTPFTSGLFTVTPYGNIYLQYAIFTVYLAAIWLRFRRVFIPPRTFRLGLFLAIMLSIFGSLVLRTPVSYLVTYLPPLVLTFLAYFALLQTNDFDLELVLRKYYTVAVAVCIFASAQQLMYVAGSDLLIFTAEIVKTSGPLVGVVGLSSEPSNFAVALAPAAFFALRSLLLDRRFSAGSLLVVATMPMTLSALGTVALALAVLLLGPSLLSRRALVFLLWTPAMIYASVILSTQQNFETRLSDTVAVVNGAELNPGDINLSTYSWVVNSRIVREALPDNGFIGVGMGAYPEVFDKYIDRFETPTWRDSLPGRGTATSLLFKLTAEFGLLGTAAAFWFLFRHFSRTGNNYVNHAFFIAMILVYVRLGFYFVNGVPFFVLMYMYSTRPLGQRPDCQVVGQRHRTAASAAARGRLET